MCFYKHNNSSFQNVCLPWYPKEPVDAISSVFSCQCLVAAGRNAPRVQALLKLTYTYYLMT